MTGLELRAALGRLGIPHNRFAEMIGYRPESVSRWVAGSWPVPLVVRLVVELLEREMRVREDAA